MQITPDSATNRNLT